MIGITGAPVRCIVDDVDRAVEFYTTNLAFDIKMHSGPGFAMPRRNGLRLLLNTPECGGAG